MDNPENAEIRRDDLTDLIEQCKNYADKLSSLITLFIPPVSFEIYKQVNVEGIPVRRAAITFHMSRYNIRKNCCLASQKIEMLGKLIGNYNL